MLNTEILIAKHWWALALRGLAAVLFGILAFAWPELTLTVLVIFFGAYALVDGVFSVVVAFAAKGGVKRWWALLLEGALGICAGAVTFLWPGLTALVLLFIIAFWAILTGIIEIFAGIWLRKHIPGHWLLILGGIISLIFGLILWSRPGEGALAVMWLIATYAIFFGVMLIALAFMLKGVKQQAG